VLFRHFLTNYKILPHQLALSYDQVHKCCTDPAEISEITITFEMLCGHYLQQKKPSASC